MIEPLFRFADCYFSVAAGLTLQQLRSGAAALENSPVVGVLTEALSRTLKWVAPEQVSQQSALDLKLPLEAWSIFKLDEKSLLAEHDEVPAEILRLTELANNSWQVDSKVVAELCSQALLTPLLIFLRRQQNSEEFVRNNSCLHTFLANREIAHFPGCDSVYTELGSHLVSKAMLNGLVVFYSPLLRNLFRFFDGSSYEFFHKTDDGRERHVDRKLNVLASSSGHNRFFSDLVSALESLFFSRGMPLCIADMGSGDGSLLKLVHESLAETHPVSDLPLLVAADFNLAALSTANQKLESIRHLAVEADIRNPGDFVQLLRNHNVNPNDVLHLRTFIDHDRGFSSPNDLTEAKYWDNLNLGGTYLDSSGKPIPATHVFQSLVEHLRGWRKNLGLPGLLLLEVHRHRYVHQPDRGPTSNANHFEAFHALSGQQLVEADNFLLAAAAAGMQSNKQFLVRYPRHESFTQFSLHWLTSAQFWIRPAVQADLDSVIKLERECWGDLSASRDQLERRISNTPSGYFLMFDIETNQLIASLATQRILSLDTLRSCSFETIEALATPHGQVLQLLALNVSPSHQGRDLGSELIQFILEYAELSDEITEVCGVTRCRTRIADSEHAYRQKIEETACFKQFPDPIVRFHAEHGAKVEGCVENFRTKDAANFGLGILIRYAVRQHGERDQYASVPNKVGQLICLEDLHGMIESIASKSRMIKPFSPDTPLMDFGFDSLDIMELRTSIESVAGISLSNDFFFSYPTPEKIAAKLAQISSLKDQANTANETRPVALDAESVTSSTDLPMKTRSQQHSIRPVSIPSVVSGPMDPIQSSDTSIPLYAIVGMGCRFPGGINDVQQYWSFLKNGLSAISEVPSSRWNIDDFYDSNPDAPGKMWSRRGGFVSDIDQFDANFFNISPREARMMDPQQRMLLETTWLALEDAGIDPSVIAGANVGVFVGIGATDYFRYVMSERSQIDAYCATGTFQSTASGRLSYVFDFNGPSVTVDTACSSAMSALHLACQSIRQKESSMAIVAGANFLSPEVSINFTKARMLSPQGECFSFDDRANGYVRGEGCGVVLVKSLESAMADRDRIYAVIRGTAMNQDGHSNGLTAPNGESQRSLLRHLLKSNNVHPEQVCFAEAHGTGTSLGDPIEANALIDVLRREPNSSRELLLGSVKTNLGHLEAASGVAAIIKVALALYHGEIPGNRNFENWNPGIDRAGVNVRVPQATVQLPKCDQAGPGIVTISSFGFGGTNVMAALQGVESVPHSMRLESERSLHDELQERTTGQPQVPAIVCVSSKTTTGLSRSTAKWLEFVSSTPLSLEQVSRASQTSRKHFSNRLAFVGRTKEEIIDQLNDVINELPPTSNTLAGQIAFCFTGQGSQYPRMGRLLFESFGHIRRVMEYCFAMFSECGLVDLKDVMFDQRIQDSKIHDTKYTQSSLFTLEYAIADYLRACGITPSVCFGHSVGELTAAAFASVISLDDAISIVAKRGELLSSLPREGSMAACFTDESTILPYLSGRSSDVSIAATNSTGNTVISGKKEVINDVVNELAARGVQSQLLTVSHAFHSPLVKNAADEFQEFCERFNYRQPSCELIANVTGQPFTADNPMNALYLRQHLLGTVRFRESLEWMNSSQITMIEIGPNNTLLSFAKRTVPERVTSFIPTCRNGSEAETFGKAISILYQNGAGVAWNNYQSESVPEKVNVPHYQFERVRYWVPIHQAEMPPSSDPTMGDRLKFLNSSLHLLEAPGGDVFAQLTVNRDSLPVIFEHRIGNRVLFPVMGYAGVCMEIAKRLPADQEPEVTKTLTVNLTDAKIVKPFTIDPDLTYTLFVHLKPSPGDHSEPTADAAKTGAWEVSISQRRIGGTRWQVLFQCKLMIQASSKTSQATLQNHQSNEPGQVTERNQFYGTLLQNGYQYGPLFQNVTGLSDGGLRIFANIDYSSAALIALSDLEKTIAVLDSACQPALEFRTKSPQHDGALWVPIGWRSMAIDTQVVEVRSFEVLASNCIFGESEYNCDAQATSSAGIIIELLGCRFAKLSREGAAPTVLPKQQVTESTTVASTPQGSDGHEVESELATRLKERLSSILLLEDSSKISIDSHFADLGMDSIMATEMELEIEDIIGKSLPPGILSSLNSLRDVLAYLGTETSSATAGNRH